MIFKTKHQNNLSIGFEPRVVTRLSGRNSRYDAIEHIINGIPIKNCNAIMDLIVELFEGGYQDRVWDGRWFITLNTRGLPPDLASKVYLMCSNSEDWIVVDTSLPVKL